MVHLTAFSERDIGNRERLEDYAITEFIITPAGLQLQIALVCDGAGGGDAGEMAARLTARSIVDHMKVSTEQNIPRLLMDAVTDANQLVYSELRGGGTSTVGVVAIHTEDPTAPNGRLFIASVGDSYLCLMRDNELVRLNIDHTLANEYVYAGQMSLSEAKRLENADYPTRVIGVNPDIQVDIGFYVERGNSFVNSQRAFNIGKKGLVLKEGDSIFAATDGIFRLGEDSRKSFVRREELLRHALDDNVEHAVQSILRYGASRRPDDNLALAMVYVPSRNRHPVRLSSGMSRRQRLGFGIFAFIALLLIIFFGSNFVGSQLDNRNAQSTQDTISLIAVRLSQTPTHTPTATPSPTATPTFTPTIRPTVVVVNQVGFQHFQSSQDNAKPSKPVFIGNPISDQAANYAIIEGLNAEALPNTYQAANIFLQPESAIQLDNVNNQASIENMEILLFPNSDIFVNSGNFWQGGVEVSILMNAGIQFEAQASCIAAKEITPNLDELDTPEKVVFTCFTGDENSCQYLLPGSQPVTMSIGQRYLLDIDNLELIESGDIIYEEVKSYYDTVFNLTGDASKADCLEAYLDSDGDTIPYPLDECEFEAGTQETGGCPDSDNDGLRDNIDQCPTAGDRNAIDETGCLLNTATPLPDSDGDGLNDALDLCPFRSGEEDLFGCPASTETP